MDVGPGFTSIMLERENDRLVEENEELRSQVEWLENQMEMYKRFWEETEYQMKNLEQEYLK